MTDRLPAVSCPALIVQGADDEYGTPAQVESIVAGISGLAEALIVPGCGHTPRLEARDVVLPAIARFVGRLVG